MPDVITTTPRDAAYERLGDSFFKLTLARENKAVIFEHGLSKLSQNEKEASNVLENLAKWNPPASSLFTQRSPSTISDTPFRLIFPNSALPHFKKTGLYVRQYIALSYCWRTADFVPGESEGRSIWPVSQPFVDAILSDAIDSHPRVGIWMDQLCIDQTSSIDKQKSVAAMDIIYRSCLRLLVLLEDVSLNTQEVALYENYDLAKVKSGKARMPEGDERDVFLSFFDKVNKARWWERAWCFHEFNVSEPWSDRRQCEEISNATFILNGPEGSAIKIKWYKLHVIMVDALNLRQSSNDFKGREIFVGSERGDVREDGWRSSLMARHNTVSQKGSMHLADQLSIMINMCGLALAYMGQRLESKEEVFFLSALLALAAGEVYPLSMVDVKPERHNPTWLAHSISIADISLPRFKLGGINGIHRVSVQEIELDMIFLNTALEIVLEKDIGSTYEIFPDTITTTQPLSRAPHEILGILPKTDPDTSLDKMRRQFLAGCILNGHSFTARLWTQLKRDIVTVKFNNTLYEDLAPNPSLYTAAQSFLAQLGPKSTLLGVSPPPIFTLEDAQAFLTWLTDPRSMYYISALTFRVQCTSDHHRAFVTRMPINKRIIEGQTGDLRAAVPIDLLDATCEFQRVWILRAAEDKQGEDKWRIVGKALLLGEPDLMSEAEKEDAVVVSRKRVVVSD